MDYLLFKDQFRRLFEGRWERSELANYDDLREKFAFHMADVCKNLTALAEWYVNPTSCDIQCLRDRVELFFNDCVPHFMAAANIYGDIPQLFEEQKGVHDWDGFRDDDNPDESQQPLQSEAGS